MKECPNHPGRQTRSLGLCASCYNAEWQRRHPGYSKAWFNRQGPEYTANINARHRAEDPDKFRSRWLKSKYGINQAQYLAMQEAQDGLCDICKEPAFPLHVDHDADTKVVRALLCGRCNRGIGMFDHDPDKLQAAAQYMLDHARR